MQVVLLEPEIPFNTGAIGRTCVATNTELHLIRPYGFTISDKHIKRAGMDYWEKLKLREYLDYEDFMKQNSRISFDGEPEANVSTEQPKLWFATTKGRRTYAEVSFGPNDYLMFGKESAGIPEEILIRHPDACIRIPMWGDIRSLNLSNAAAVVLYEALRQNGFEHMEKQGQLHHHRWEETKRENG